MRLLSFPTLPLLLIVLHHGTVSSVVHRVSPLSQMLGLPLKPKQRASPLSKLLRGPKKPLPKTTLRSYLSSACDPEFDTFDSCLATNTPDYGDECIACFNGQLPEEYQDCVDLASIVCNAINVCDVECGGCSESFAEWQSCEYSATTECGPFTCDDDPIPPDPEDCETAEDALVNCIETTGDGCLSCIVANFPAYGLDCYSAPDYICTTLPGVCQECGSCVEEFAALLVCSDTECDPFTCDDDPIPPDPEDPCETAEAALTNCMETSGAGFDACNACIDDTFPAEGLSCEEFPGYFCALPDVCPECGSCEEEFADLLASCYECPISCDDPVLLP